jgi:hypothetical protein
MVMLIIVRAVCYIARLDVRCIVSVHLCNIIQPFPCWIMFSRQPICFCFPAPWNMTTCQDTLPNIPRQVVCSYYSSAPMPSVTGAGWAPWVLSLFVYSRISGVPGTKRHCATVHSGNTTARSSCCQYRSRSQVRC